jgi:NAD(P) transhydrogenase
VPGCGGTVDLLVDAAFHDPTLADSYKVAARDALNKIWPAEWFCE